MPDKGLAGAGGALQALNSFMLGFAGEKERRRRDAIEQRRVTELEERTGIMQADARWKKEERWRLKRQREETHNALARMIGKLGEMKSLDKDPQAMRAEVMLNLFDVVRDNPDVDLGTISTFATGAADFLFPKKDVKTTVVESIGDDGLRHNFLINMETGEKIEDLGAVEKGVGTAGTKLEPGDFNKWYSDMWAAYLKEYNQAIENIIASGKFLHGVPLMVSPPGDTEKNFQRQREAYAMMRTAALEKVGTFRDYLARFSVGLVGKPGDFEKFLNAVAPKLPDKPMVTFQQYLERFNGAINAQGWTPDTLRTLLRSTGASADSWSRNAPL